MRVAFAILVVALSTSPLLADRVQRSSLTNLLPISGATSFVNAFVASAPDGASIAAWVINPGSAPSSVQFVVYDRRGNLVAGPTSIALNGRVPWGVHVGATPQGFMLVYDAQPNTTTPARDIFYVLVSRTGTVAGSGQVNATSTADENLPRVTGNLNGSFAVAWRRSDLNQTSPAGFSLTTGVFVRRLQANGNAIDASDVRVDTANQNRGDQGGIAIGTWRSRLVVAWHDGIFGGGPSVSGSPDGFGQGIVARWFDAPAAGGLTPLGPEAVITTSTAWDQFEPIIEVDHRNSCVIGWCGDTTDTYVDAYARRFDDAGNALDATELNLTPTDTTNSQFLMDVGMSAHGEAVCTWMSTPSTAGQPASRVGFARLAQNGTIIESNLVESGGSAFEAHAFPRIGVDEYGNFLCVYQVGTTPNHGLRVARFSRTVLTINPTTGFLGLGHALSVDSPSDANRVFVVACSLGQGPLPVDTRTLRLDFDFVFNLSVYGPPSGVFFDFIGVLDANGQSSTTTPPVLVLPFIPALSGAQLYFAVATDGPTAPSGLNTISDTLVLPIN